MKLHRLTEGARRISDTFNSRRFKIASSAGGLTGIVLVTAGLVAATPLIAVPTALLVMGGIVSKGVKTPEP